MAHALTRRDVLKAALLAVPASCAHRGPDAYTDWVTVTTEHFDVHTPLPGGRAEAFAFRLETIYRAIAGNFFPNDSINLIEVLLFEREEDWRDAIREAQGAPTEGKPEGGILLLGEREGGGVRRDSSQSRYSTGWQAKTAREITQRLLKKDAPGVPPWMRVGLIEYVETMQVDGTQVLFGRRSMLLKTELAAGRIVPLADLLAAPAARFRESDWRRRHEASAWAFLHYLMHAEEARHHAKLAGLLQALHRTEKDSAKARAVLEAQIIDEPFERFQEKFHHYAVETLGRRPAVHPFAVTVVPPGDTRGIATAAAPAHVRSLLLQLKKNG